MVRLSRRGVAAVALLTVAVGACSAGGPPGVGPQGLLIPQRGGGAASARVMGTVTRVPSGKVIARIDGREDLAHGRAVVTTQITAHGERAVNEERVIGHTAYQRGAPADSSGRALRRAKWYRRHHSTGVFDGAADAVALAESIRADAGRWIFVGQRIVHGDLTNVYRVVERRPNQRARSASFEVAVDDSGRLRWASSRDRDVGLASVYEFYDFGVPVRVPRPADSQLIQR